MSTPTRRGIYGKLAGDTVLQGLLGAPPDGYSQSIYHNEAPDNARFPLITFAKSSGVPTETFGDPDGYDTEVWLVKCIDRSASADTAEAVAARISVLLNDANLSISGSTLMYLRRQSDIEFPEVVNGVSYRHAGSMYRLVYE